jgi:hypothetical protein
MATFSTINNGDTGLVARTAINAIINHINTPAFQTLTDSGGTVSWSYPLGYNAKLTLTQSVALDITGATNGDYGTIITTQDATGGWVINFGANDKFASATHSFTATGTASDIFTWVYDGTDYYWNYNKDFS